MICAQCNKEFTPIHWSQKYCSKECLQIHKKEYQKKYRQLDSYKDYQKNYGQSERGKGVTKKSREKNLAKIGKNRQK